MYPSPLPPSIPEAARSRSRLCLPLASRLVAAMISGLAALAPDGAAWAQQPSRWVAGELLIGLRAGVGPNGRAALIRDHGATYVDDVGRNIRVIRIRVPTVLMDAIARRLERRPEVRFVERNYVFDPVLTPNDSEYGGQWHLPKIQAPQAWDVTQGSPGAVIAILDSGLDASHPDFAGKLVAGYNTYASTTDTSDAYGHGTEVAGAAGALTNNALGVAGVAGAAPIMPVRVTDATGRATSTSLANGITWAVDHGARVVNLSFAGVVGNAAISAAADYANAQGALVVAASGNCGCADPTPDNPHILSVSATDETDSPAYFSTTGPFVDLAAPGNNILTTGRFGTYLAESGTSLASPIVAGVAGLMFSANSRMTPALVTQLLEATAVDPNGGGYTESLGYGRVNALAAVNAAAGYVPPVDTTAPTASLIAPLTNATVSGTVPIDVTASDDVGVVKVDLFVDGAFFVSDTLSPYSFAWDTSALPNGTHTLRAVATDAANNGASTATITVTVSNTPPDTTAPVVALTAPAAGATVSGVVTVSASATDNVGVAKVVFSVDGVLAATVTAAPYSFGWNTTALTNGAHTLLAVATDAAGNSASTTRTVMVSNAPADTQAPTLSVSKPTAGATVTGTATVTATASDNVAVTRVELYVDNVLTATDTAAPYSFSWNTTLVSNGPHTVKVLAADAAGNIANVTRSVTVSNNKPPIAVNDAYTVPRRASSGYPAQVFSLLANDSDPDGSLNVASVKIGTKPNKGGAVTVNTNGTLSYTPKTGYAGAETFTYTVKDAAGATSNTATVTVTVQ